MIADTRDVIRVVIRNNYKKIYLAHFENAKAEGIARYIKDTLSKKGVECLVGADCRKKGVKAVCKAIDESDAVFDIDAEEGIAS